MVDRLTESENNRISKLLTEIIQESQNKKYVVPEIKLGTNKSITEKSNYATIIPEGIKKYKIEINQILIDLDDMEVKSILAHEVYHAIRKHIFLRVPIILILFFFFYFSMFPILSLILNINKFNIIYTVEYLILFPIGYVGYYVFSIITEYNADSFAKLLEYDTQLIEALIKVRGAKYNVFMSIILPHPSIDKRIEKLKK